MIARDFKAWAREVLRGRWGTAIAVCLVTWLLSGGGVPVPNTSGMEDLDISMIDLADVWPMAATAALVVLLVSLVIGGALSFGSAHYFTNLTANRPSRFVDLFSRFKIWYKAIGMFLLVGLFVFLWILPGVLIAFAVSVWWVMQTEISGGAMILVYILLVIGVVPGYVAMYRYAMMPFLLAEFPDLTVMDAMRESKRLMKGNKWRLYCLEWSFLGWYILAIMTLFIGFLWLTPYINAAKAAFYLEVTGRSGLRYPQPEE